MPLSGGRQLLRCYDIVVARLYLSRRMVMGNNHFHRVIRYGSSKYLSWMHKGARKSPYEHRMTVDNPLVASDRKAQDMLLV